MEKKEKNMAGLFIPGGLMIGMGIGFIIDNIPGGMFVGLGAGFILSAFFYMYKK